MDTAQIIKKLKLYLFDMDGTLYIGNNLFDFTVELLATIKKNGGRYMFMTNNSSKSVKDYILKLEKLGIAATEEFTLAGNYQWAYPNGWAPLHFVTVKALLNYGYIDDAKRIALKYIQMVEENFKKTGNLWEKYNVADGSINATNEYEMPPMLGWTAGVYLLCKDVLEG